MKVWGCPAYVKRIVSDKLDDKSDKCLFVGYPKETNGYYFYHALEQKVFISKHAVFLEKEFLLKEDSGSKIELDEVHDPQMDMDQPTDPEFISHDDEVIGEPMETQTYRCWNIHFDETIKEFGFSQNEDEPCVYKKVSGSAVVFLVLYVDDILLMENDVFILQSVKIWLSKQFSMKDFWKATYILGDKDL